jgi:hypothetical protein
MCFLWRFYTSLVRSVIAPGWVMCGNMVGFTVVVGVLVASGHGSLLCCNVQIYVVWAFVYGQVVFHVLLVLSVIYGGVTSIVVTS